MKLLTYTARVGETFTQEVVLCNRHAEEWLRVAAARGVRDRYEVREMEGECELCIAA